MDSWYQPSRSRYSPEVRGIPVQQCHRKPNNSSSPKIISIPVHFIGSETAQSASALKIQKVFRGFLVRKSIKRILAIESEVEEIERRLLKKETMELIRKDAKERLRVNETLMALLFKLDSIRGVYPGIRDCRKAVIKKAVALQEKVDCIVSAPDQTLVSADDGDEEVDVENSNSVAESVDHSLEMKEIESLNFEDGMVECQGNENYDCVSTESPVDLEYNLNQDLQPEKAIERNLDLAVPSEVSLNSVVVESLTENCEKVDSEVIADEEPCVVKEITEDCSATPTPTPTPYVNDCVEEKDIEADSQQKPKEHSENSEGLIEEGKEEQVLVASSDENKGNRELLERMMGENEKMMKLMSQLCERNEMQTHMLTSLTQRVERLEKAFMCNKLRNKKKKKTNHTA